MNSDDGPSLWDFGSNWHFCRFCKHLHSLIGELTCDAFPEGHSQRAYLGADIARQANARSKKNDIVFAPAISKI